MPVYLFAVAMTTTVSAFLWPSSSAGTEEKKERMEEGREVHSISDLIGNGKKQNKTKNRNGSKKKKRNGKKAIKFID